MKKIFLLIVGFIIISLFSQCKISIDEEGIIHINGIKLEHKREIHLEEHFSGNLIIFKTGSGDIDISGSKQDIVSLDIIIYEKESSDASVYLEKGMLKTKSNGGYPVYISSIKGTIPDNISVDFSTGSGDMIVSNLHNSERIILDAGSGNVHIKECEDIKCLNIDTGSGDISITNLRNLNELIVDCGSGDSKIYSTEIKNADFDTGSGDIRIIYSKIGFINADTGSGDIIFEKSTYDSGQFNTGSGEVIIKGDEL